MSVCLYVSVFVSVSVSVCVSLSYLHDRLVAQARAFFSGLYQVISPDLLGKLAVSNDSVAVLSK
jgi:hypothetical protein